MTLSEMYPYIIGESFTRDAVAPYRISETLFNEISQMVADSDSASQNLSLYEVPKNFYDSEPDILHYVPKMAQEEIFYSLKLGYAVPAVPAKFVYYLTKGYKRYKLPNMLFLQLSNKDLTVFFQKDYLGENLCAKDVVCSLFDNRYSPLCDSNLICRYDDFSEVYVKSCEMVAALPNDIANMLSLSDIRKIDLKPGGLAIGDVYLRTMGGHYGATRSIFDLRECI